MFRSLSRAGEHRGWDTRPVFARRKAISPSRGGLSRDLPGGSKGGDACARRANYARSRAGGSPPWHVFAYFLRGQKVSRRRQSTLQKSITAR